MLDSFGESKNLVGPNQLNVFLLGAIVVGLTMAATMPVFMFIYTAPSFAPFVGLLGGLVVGPYIFMLYVVVYLTLLGEPTVRQQPGDQPL